MPTDVPATVPSLPATGRAAVYERTGGPEVLHVVDRPVTAPAPGEVLVRVHRSGVNPTDWKSRSGRTGTAGPGAELERPQVPNQDGSGVVVALGDGVDAALLGRRVWLWESAWQRTDGTAQQYAPIPAGQAVPMPDTTSFDLGAALGVPFVTAHRCLTVTEDGPDHLAPGALAGRTVLVSGGAGAVGNAAIQLARWAGATVITTVSSPAKAALARAAGADHVVDYRSEDVVAAVRRIAPRGVETIVEVAAAANATIDVQVVAANGSVAVYADDGGAELQLPVRASMTTNARWQFVLLYTAPAAAKQRAIADITAALEAGVLGVGEAHGLPLHHLRLDAIGEAHAAVERGVVGKVLVDVTEDTAAGGR